MAAEVCIFLEAGIIHKIYGCYNHSTWPSNKYLGKYIKLVFFYYYATGYVIYGPEQN